MAVEQILIEM